MKYKNLLLLSSLCLLVFCFNAPPEGEIDKEKVIKKVRQVLTYLHFSPKTIDDDFSHQVYDRYVESLDPFKRNFTQNEVDALGKFRDNLDEYFQDEDLTFYNLSADIYYNSIKENEKMVNEIFKEDLNFEEEDYLIIDEDKKAFPKNKEEKKAEWRRYLKYLILDEVQTIKEDEKNESKTKEEILELAQEKVEENMEDYYRRVNSRNKDELFNVYINAFAEDFDPHTYYFSPKNKEYFNQGISGSFEGIGATLADEKGYATIKSLIIGGPAWKSKKVYKEDKIIEVAEKGEEAVNIVGMPLDDAIMLIRGKKGSEVILTLKREDGSIEKVTIERDKIEIEESYVKSTVLSNQSGHRVGYIFIPSFYIDVYDRQNGRNVSEDVRKELIKLRQQKVESIVLDVRNNGGGSLGEVVDIVGLFIDKGPVVQVRDSEGKEKVYYDTDEDIVWDGPLAVMTNEFSASASEILAGAIQDYGRGIIIGSAQTYGKGTVQQVIPLERFTETSSLGDLKLTIQKFYRITGASTQLEGVKSDILLPSKYEFAEIKEGAYENALPWDEVNTLNYKKWTLKYDLKDLQNKSLQRMSNSKYTSEILEEAKYIETIKNEEKIALKYEDFMSNLKRKEDKLEKFKGFEKTVETGITIEAIAPKEEITDSIAINKLEEWHKDIKKDIYIQETLNILDDAM